MDLGTFAVSVPSARAIAVEDERRLTYAAWYSEIRSVAGGLRRMGLRQGDHLVVVMPIARMATLYWAAMLGLVFTPVGRRVNDELKWL